MEHLGGVLILLMDENVYKLTVHDYTLNAIIIYYAMICCHRVIDYIFHTCTKDVTISCCV